MAVIVDRRLNPSGKSHINRQRFLDRVKDQIQDSVKKSIADNNIKDIGNGENIKIRSKDLSEPTFHNDQETGKKKFIRPGNDRYSVGDGIPKPNGGIGGGGKNSGTGEGNDDFEFILTKEEFLNYLFEDLELPDFVKDTLKVTDTVKYNKSGFTGTGSPANLSIERTFKNSIGRRLALARPSEDELVRLQEEIDALQLKIDSLTDEKKIKKFSKELALIQDELDRKKSRQKTIPFIDENDLQYVYYAEKPQPASQAVMFCLMDVSGSMGQDEKDISKRFFLLLYLFLERKYDKIDIKFIRHTDVAEEVDEHTFFYDTESGGTKISSGLLLIEDIIKDKYPVSDWNIYIAQCTDGDNFPEDNKLCEEIIRTKLQPIVQYFAYIQVDQMTRASYMGILSSMYYTAWPLYKKLSDEFNNIVCKQIPSQNLVWTVFSDLFKKRA